MRRPRTEAEGMQMLLTNEIVIDAPADQVWEIVANRFDRIGEWATVIPSSVALEESALRDAPVAGRVCQTGVRGIPQVTETIVEYDEATRTLTYEATAGLPPLVTLARNTWQVVALGNNKSRATYSGQLQVHGLLGQLAKRLLLARVARDGQFLLEDLKHYAEHHAPSPHKVGDHIAAVGARPTSRVLRAALRANAVFSCLSGLVLVAAGWWYPLVAVVGVLVAGFGLLVAAVAAAPADQLRRKATAVLGADLLWVAGSAILLTLARVPAGVGVAIELVAAVVAGLAGWQIAGLVAMRRDDTLADLEVIEVRREIPAPPQRMWQLVTDHQLYGRLAPNLSKVEVISQPGEPLHRRCTNNSGRHWEEACTQYHEGRSFAVDVDTSDYPYPLRVMRGLWQVDPHPRGSTVTMRFVYQAEPTIRGGLFAIALRLRSTRTLHSILDGWQREATVPVESAQRTAP